VQWDEISPFDDLTLHVARARSRREALKLFGKGLFGIAVGGAATLTLAPPMARAEDCLVEYPPADLDNCPNKRHHPGASPSINGCGPADSVDLVSDTFGPVNFAPGCNVHDQCYGTCNSDREQCDDDMADAMRLACTNQWADSVATWPLLAACYRVADAYWLAVRAGGAGAWETAQKEDCECCHPVPAAQVYCACNDTCYPDPQSCLAVCKVGLGCFTGICGPATQGECS
jgi:secretory phospholipase A2